MRQATKKTKPLNRHAPFPTRGRTFEVSYVQQRGSGEAAGRSRKSGLPRRYCALVFTTMGLLSPAHPNDCSIQAMLVANRIFEVFVLCKQRKVINWIGMWKRSCGKIIDNEILLLWLGGWSEGIWL
ncbi:hypothetical protein Ddc_15622 [Ditylenchus destructor]|nr:hypothetical protein Ddc_15622 [Ditylenchus destructor]